MTRAKQTPQSEARQQRSKFIDAARELGCDEDPEAFKRALRKLAEAPPAPQAA